MMNQEIREGMCACLAGGGRQRNEEVRPDIIVHRDTHVSTPGITEIPKENKQDSMARHEFKIQWGDVLKHA